MKSYDFINSHIGQKVYITGDRDLAMCHEFRVLIFNKIQLDLLKLTKNGMAYLYNSDTKKYYSVPPSNVRLVGDDRWISYQENLEKK